MTSRYCGWPSYGSYLTNSTNWVSPSFTTCGKIRAVLSKSRAILGSEDDYKDQIHDETARQSRWALGIGLTVFSF
jgi:hypothetical protein